MNAGGSKTRKKSSPKTPGKGQKTLSSYLSNFVSKRSPTSNERLSHSVPKSQVVDSQRDNNKESGKKRKLNEINFGDDSNEQKSKKTLSTDSDDITNVISTSLNSSNIKTSKHNEHELIDISNNHRSENELESIVPKCISESEYESKSDKLKPTISKYFSNDGKKGESTKKLSADSSRDEIDKDFIEISNMKLKTDSILKENSFELEPKLLSKKKSSSPEFCSSKTTKKFSPLKTDSQNVQISLNKKGEDSNTIEDNNSMRMKSDVNESVNRGESSIKRMNNSNGKGIANDVLTPNCNIDASGFEDDELFFQVFDKSFKSEDEDKLEKQINKECESNSQLNSHVLTNDDDFDDIFDDDWNGDMEVDDNVDLSRLERCQVSNVCKDKFNNLIVNVLHVDTKNPVTVTLMGFWREAKVEKGDIINIQATRESGSWIVDNNNGFVIEQPDFLVSGTSVVGALFCQRRGVLSDRFKGIESVTDCRQGSSLMAIGSLVHELLQEVLKKKIYTKPGIAKLLREIIDSQHTANLLYSASMSTETCEKEMLPFVTKIFHFIERYVKGKPSQTKDANFNGKINAVRDIEENLWVPQLGIKGKVDVTVEVKVNLKPRIMPLELKTGRASFSLEHRGQIILYTMMMAITGQEVETGLLLYLRENIMREIKVGHPERRDLILLRNNLAYYLTRKPERENRTDSGLESQSLMETMRLPEPINHRACQNCPYNALCCSYLKDDENLTLHDRHPLTTVMKEVDNYLKPEHIEYVKKWVRMLQIEEADQAESSQPLKSIWTVPPAQREKEGKCISNLIIIGKVIEESNRYRHTFSRNNFNDLTKLNCDLTKSGFSMREYVIISTDTKFNISAGPIIELCKDSLTVLLERNLADRKSNELFHIDSFTSQSLLIINLSNVGYLLDNNPVTEKMRKIVIERLPGTFLKQLDRSFATVAAKVLKPLNKTQRRAVLKVLSSNDYLLIRGMPGSGKTVTLVAIIELLVKLGKSVLLTAHTHSAVDNVLLKLIKTDIDFVRLGSQNKIHPLLLSKSESVLTKECYTAESLDAAYNSKNVVCVTCLAANHPLLGKRMFDVCLVDESTQVLQSSILRPLYSASKFVLIGDPDQLPPVVKSSAARELGMDQSLFERLDSDNNTITLTSQYRMNQRIMSIANKVTYKDQLTADKDEISNATLDIPNKAVLKSCEQWVRAVLSTELDDSVAVLDIGDKYKILKDEKDDDYHAERRCSNLCEVAVILNLVTTLIKAGVLAEKIGIIAPYREQVSLLRTIVKQDVEVNTVDQYQGRDKEVILYSGTKSSYVKSEVEKEFNILDDHRRLTVAITRAKHKLIIVCDVRTLKQFKPFEKLFEQIRDKDLIKLENGSSDFNWEELLSVVKDK